MQNTIRLFGGLGALAVAIGAFGAHGLKSLVGPAELETFSTGVRYHFYHVFAIGFTAAFHYLPGVKPKLLRRAAWAFAVGILLFSGSLYLLGLRDVHGLPAAALGPVTPIGGLFFIAGWVCLLFAPGKIPSND